MAGRAKLPSEAPGTPKRGFRGCSDGACDPRLTLELNLRLCGGHAAIATTAPWGRYSARVMAESSEDSGLRRVTRQGEEAIGKLAQELLENPVVSGALTAALQTRERATHAQEAALSALNLPSASDLARLTRRLRSVSQRLEGIEDGLDRVEQKLSHLEGRLDQQAAVVEEPAAAARSESAG